MNKKSTILVCLFLFFIIGTTVLFSSFRSPVISSVTKHGYHGPSRVYSSWRPTLGSTGFIPTKNCSNNSADGLGCHNSYAVNAGNGSVSVSGLPAFYTPNQTYDFSVKISSTAAGRKAWGFSIIAKKQDGTSIGTFDGSLNDSADIYEDELCHGDTITFYSAYLVPVANEYTYTNLRWKAPATDQGQVTFYYAGVAGNVGGAPLTGPLGDYVYTGSTLVGTIPVSLSAFEAVVKNKNNVWLTWQTAQELNTDYFEVQRSLDGIQFATIGTVPASGNSSIPRDYHFTDTKLSDYERPVYYRLSMVDKDGSNKYSATKNIILKTTGTFLKSVYPNPVAPGGTLHLTLISNQNETATARLIDLNGKTIKTFSAGLVKGNNQADLKLPALSSGNYKLIINCNGATLEEPIMVY